MQQLLPRSSKSHLFNIFSEKIQALRYFLAENNWLRSIKELV